MRNGRVSRLSTKGWLSPTRGLLLPLPTSHEEPFCYLAFRRICSFSLHLPPGHRPADFQHILCSILRLVSTGGESFNPTFPEDILIFLCNLSFS